MSIEEDLRRHARAAHAMQSGVAAIMTEQPDDKATDPKHLRVGVNTALCDHAALVKLLVEKGVITDAEYAKAIADMMEVEKQRYEERLSKLLGMNVTLD